MSPRTVQRALRMATVPLGWRLYLYVILSGMSLVWGRISESCSHLTVLVLSKLSSSASWARAHSVASG